MKILLIGASGTIGKAVAKRLGEHHVISANYSKGDINIDLNDPQSIKNMFNTVGEIDAIISTAGVANFAPLGALTDHDYSVALSNKLMGQVNLVRFGQNVLSKNGSITITSGVLSRQPMQGSAVISMANGALESYIKAAALELDTLRVNVVAPAFVKETMAMMGMDTTGGISAEETANAYIAALTGDMHGETLDAPDYC